ncbi:MAG: membrane protein insertase YidC [Gemmatimonadales bacterium]
MNDRRPLFAIALIMLIAMVPSLLLKKPAPKPNAAQLAAGDTTQTPALTRSDSGPPVMSAAPATSDSTIASAPVVAEDTVVVRSPLYRYAISTHGGRMISSRFLRYKSMARGDTLATGKPDTLELLPAGSSLLDAKLAIAGDTVRLDRVTYTASVDSLTPTDGNEIVTFTGTTGTYGITLRYHFAPDDFRVHIDGEVTGLSAGGGTLLVSLGDGFRDSEKNLVEDHRERAIVTKQDGTKLTRIMTLVPRQPTTLSGPFEWVAVKSKYFVVGAFSYDSLGPKRFNGRIGGLRAIAPDALPEKPVRASIAASLSVPASGKFGVTFYVGPMEYDRLNHMGHDFDDVNPYGWAWLRPVIRPIAVALRDLFIWMHHALGLGYGLVIVSFGIMIRLVLWPLNQKAMRSMTAMQAIQPQLTAIQEKHKEDPARLQQEMFKLYKENNVNPFGGCWPMLLPYPMLVAVFFVLQNTIELRGVSFLWMPDLAQFDPLYIIPVLMASSMFAVSKIGMMGMPPNPQTKMMSWLMPLMMLIFFSKFASGLNLYYAVQNMVSLPQQWLIMKERRKVMEARNAPVVIGTKRK